jgi:type IV pilus assembly protein PilB
MAGHRIGEFLVKEGLIKAQQLEKALEIQKRTGQRFGVILVEQNFINEQQIAKAMEKLYQIPSVDLSRFELDPAVVKSVGRDVCEKNCVVPVMKQGNVLVVAFSDPSNIFLRDDLSFLTRSKIQVVVASEVAILGAINKYFGEKMAGVTLQSKVSAKGEEVFALEGLEAGLEFLTTDGGGATGLGDDAPIVKFVNMVLAEALKKRASDVHFEPYERRFRIRFRIDGSLQDAMDPPQGSTSAIVSRLKIMSRMDIAEKRKPQDGRIKAKTSQGKEIDFRVSTIPTMWGEKVVLRLLDKSNLQLDMAKLGFEPEDLKLFRDAIHLPQGLVLITGPTGSGKTTTIYSALQELNTPDVNISTAEDPIEFNFEGINQVQMNPDINLNFSVALKAFLRQDPDIVMVGEIRDLETAEIAFKAASTGHLVVSTLHTNDAPSTIVRLTEMGIPNYLITSTVNLVVAQRLVGRVCENCKHPFEVNPQTLINMGVDPKDVGEYQLARGKGCSFCNNTGVKGRLAIYELMPITEKIKEAVMAGATSTDLRILARTEGMRTLRRSGLLKLKRGQTTIEEVLSASVKDT